MTWLSYQYSCPIDRGAVSRLTYRLCCPPPYKLVLDNNYKCGVHRCPCLFTIITDKHFQIFKMDSQAKYLLSLRAIRDRAKIVGDVAKSGKLSHFDLHEEKLDEVVDFVASVIKVVAQYSLQSKD